MIFQGTQVEVAKILTVAVLNLLLPTADIVTDLILAVKLYKVSPKCEIPPGCVYWYYKYDYDSNYDYDYGFEDYLIMSDRNLECDKDPLTFCSKHENRQYCHYETCFKLQYYGNGEKKDGEICGYSDSEDSEKTPNGHLKRNDPLFVSYEKCLQNPGTFCSLNGNRQHCPSHPKMATALLTPFLLNYIVCFYTFLRLTTHRKKYLFIFPLLSLYPQYGKTHSS